MEGPRDKQVLDVKFPKAQKEVKCIKNKMLLLILYLINFYNYLAIKKKENEKPHRLQHSNISVVLSMCRKCKFIIVIGKQSSFCFELLLNMTSYWHRALYKL